MVSSWCQLLPRWCLVWESIWTCLNRLLPPAQHFSDHIHPLMLPMFPMSSADQLWSAYCFASKTLAMAMANSQGYSAALWVLNPSFLSLLSPSKCSWGNLLKLQVPGFPLVRLRVVWQTLPANSLAMTCGWACHQCTFVGFFHLDPKAHWLTCEVLLDGSFISWDGHKSPGLSSWFVLQNITPCTRSFMACCMHNHIP